MRRPQKTCAICESGVRVVDYKDERTLSPVPDRAGQDPARAGSPGRAPGTSGSSAPRSSGLGSSRCCPTSRASRLSAPTRWRGTRRRPLGAGARSGGVPARSRRRCSSSARSPALLLVSRPASRARVGLGARARWSGPHSGSSSPAGWARSSSAPPRCWSPAAFLALTLWRPSNRMSRALHGDRRRRAGAGGVDAWVSASDGQRSRAAVETRSRKYFQRPCGGR